MSLSVKAARGGIVMLFGQGLKISLQIINLVILARLLMPEDFGLVAMVIAMFGVCDILLDFGLSTASIQVAQITKKQISNLFWINLLIGLALAIISFLLSKYLAQFYDRPELTQIAQIMSLTFILNGVSAQYKAQLNRDLQFKKLVISDIFAVAFGIAVGIYCAYHQLAYWSVVAQLITQSFAQMVFYVLFGNWIPNLPSKNVPMSGFFKFGWGLVGSQLLAYFSTSVPSILIGKQLGAIQLGLFDRANKLLMLPLNQLNAPLSSVAIPVLSRLESEDRDKYNKFLLFGQNAIINIVVLSLAMASCQTESLVKFVLGSQWLGMVPVFLGLSFAGVFIVLSYTSYWVFLTKGITTSLFKMGLVGRPIVILITSLGLFGGVVGVAYAYSLGLMFQWLLGVYWLKNTGIPVKTLIFRPTIITFSYFSAAYLSNLLVSYTPLIGDFYSLALGWLYMFLILCIFYVALPSFKESIKLLFEVKKYIRNKN